MPSTESKMGLADFSGDSLFLCQSFECETQFLVSVYVHFMTCEQFLSLFSVAQMNYEEFSCTLS